MTALVTASTTNRYDLAGLSDDALLAGTRRLVAGANHALAALLAHLAEVEARGIHRVRACSSLYTYCIYELRMSEDAAFRRAKAARLCRRFPALYDAVATGELHLTGLLMLAPHLTDDNLADTLARARHRTKREIQKLVREIDPLPDVPARIEPLGPPLVASPRNPTWSEFAASFNPVRELRPGERPADWLGSDAEPAETQPAPARPQRYKVQFTATQEHIDLLERARDLLSHAVPNRSIDEVLIRALRELVAQLEKKKYAATDNPRQRGANGASDNSTAPRPSRAKRDTESPRQRGEPAAQPPRQRGTIPAAVRRAVRKRDGARCTYVDKRGQRCRETALLELHHEQPFARGGPATPGNLSLRCRAHNALAAEEDFGSGFMRGRKPDGPDG